MSDLWIEYLPAMDFVGEYPAPTLWQLEKIDPGILQPDGTAEIPYVNGVREAIFREAILLSRKFIYCAQILPTLSGVGKNTWAAIGAYETCFYGAKALCYLLGFAQLSRDGKIYIDAFHSTERKVGKEKKKFYESLRAHKFDERMTHAVLWKLAARLIDTTVFPAELRELQTQIKLTDWDKFSNLRNNVFYDGGFWPMAGDMAACDLVNPGKNQHIIDASWLDDNVAPPIGEEYFALARLFRRLITGMLQSIATLAPAVQAEVEAFEALRRVSTSINPVN